MSRSIGETQGNTHGTFTHPFIQRGFRIRHSQVLGGDLMTGAEETVLILWGITILAWAVLRSTDWY